MYPNPPDAAGCSTRNGATESSDRDYSTKQWNVAALISTVSSGGGGTGAVVQRGTARANTLSQEDTLVRIGGSKKYTRNMGFRYALDGFMI
jgi:hypothetical protein